MLFENRNMNKLLMIPWNVDGGIETDKSSYLSDTSKNAENGQVEDDHWVLLGEYGKLKQLSSDNHSFQNQSERGY